MQHPKGGPAPFFLSMCTSRLRDDALLTRAVELFKAGQHADALLAAEYVCRRLPMNRIPAILRAKILQTAYPFMAARAWHAAWMSEPENPLLQDIMLQTWLKDGGRADVAILGPAFLPARCKFGRHESLLPTLRAAGVTHTGACWKNGDAIETMIFLASTGNPVQRATLLLSDETTQYQFDIPADGSRARLVPPRPGTVWSITLVQPDGRRQLLPGSPLAFYETPTIRDDAAPCVSATEAEVRPVSVVIPVYRELALVRACIESVKTSLPLNNTPARIVVVDDCSPEPALSAWLDKQAAAGHITLLRNACNLGFIETVNRGMRMLADHDVLLLNADTQVHGDWIDRLVRALYASPDVASVTPWTNNGEISSFPVISQAAPAPDTRELALLDQIAAEIRTAPGGADIELPSCCGFTMLIRRTVLDGIGMLDGTALIRGYSEEVDWCMRARVAGWRHLQATGVFVAHEGTVSFRAEKTLRVAQNRGVVVARYPDYYATFTSFVRADPLFGARKRFRDALEKSRASAWLRKADAAQPTAALPATVAKKPLPASLPALPSAFQRIAVWRLDPVSPAAQHILTLARMIASRPQLRLRLLVIGDAGDALLHTGVVDHVPTLQGDAMPLLDDLRLLQSVGCRAVLSDTPAGLPSKLRPMLLDDSFDAASWFNDWLTRNTSVKAA